MGYNLSELTQEEKDKINVSLAASGVAFKERYNMPVVADTVLREQPQAFHAFFSRKAGVLSYKKPTLFSFAL